MRLAAAFAVYMIEGPCNPRDGEATARALASRVVHAHLTPGEILGLARAWQDSATSREGFLRRLADVMARLEVEGKL